MSILKSSCRSLKKGLKAPQQGLDDGDFALPDDRVDAAHQLYEVPVPESQLSQQHLHETVGLNTVVVGPDGYGETIGALYSKIYDPDGNQLPGVDNQAVEAFNDAYLQAERISETRVEGYTMAAQDVALGMAAGPVASVVAGAAGKAAGPLISKAKSALGALRAADVSNHSQLNRGEMLRQKYSNLSNTERRAIKFRA